MQTNNNSCPHMDRLIWFDIISYSEPSVLLQLYAVDNELKIFAQDEIINRLSQYKFKLLFNDNREIISIAIQNRYNPKQFFIINKDELDSIHDISKGTSYLNKYTDFQISRNNKSWAIKIFGFLTKNVDNYINYLNKELKENETVLNQSIDNGCSTKIINNFQKTKIIIENFLNTFNEIKNKLSIIIKTGGKYKKPKSVIWKSTGKKIKCKDNKKRVLYKNNNNEFSVRCINNANGKKIVKYIGGIFILNV
jgi:hypothetical protein